MNTMFDGNKATGFKPQATSCFVLSCLFFLKISISNQKAKPLAACGLWLAAFLALFSVSHSASAQASFPPININLQYPQFQRLKLDGGYVYLNEGGMSGIILYRESETNYIAYERRCSVDDDAPVMVDGSGLFMKGCGSTFSFSDGYPTGGPVRNPLLKYRTSLDGTKLTITDEVVF